MEEIIKVTEKDGRKVISGRELHAYLQCGREFTTWIKDRIDRYGFTENQDFSSFDEIVKRDSGASVRKEYALTLDMAKELAMVEGNARGKQARQYFIACEKELAGQKAHTMEDLMTNPDLIIAMATEIKQLRAQAPKVEYTEKVLLSDNLIDTAVIAKELGMSAHALNKQLYAWGVQYKVGGTWVLYKKYEAKGYTKSRTHTFTDTTGAIHTSIRTCWTERGRAFIHQLFGSFGNKLKKMGS